jgi:hypothetical protein
MRMSVCAAAAQTDLGWFGGMPPQDIFAFFALKWCILRLILLGDEFVLFIEYKEHNYL